MLDQAIDQTPVRTWNLDAKIPVSALGHVSNGEHGKLAAPKCPRETH
ncbi:hypothetical protein [Rhodococcus opacus]|jgi:hypothetical protein|nr:hypothetical protein [Rhodococcus opacus]